MAHNAGKPVRNLGGVSSRFEKGGCQDVTTPKYLEMANLSQAWDPSAETILGSISDVVEVIDHRGVIVYSNISPLHQRRLGLDSVLNQRCHKVYDKVCPSCRTCPLDQVFSTGVRLILDCPVKPGGSKGKWARQHLYPMRDQDGSVTGVLRLVFDITGEKRSQAEDEKYLNSLEQSLYNRKHRQPLPPNNLSPRELQVLGYMADGLSNHDIARLLCLSPNTVKTHVSHIFNKLGVSDRTQAAVAATRLKLV
jgi:DNA-binding CsgD family transcriptional regulator